MLLLNDIGILFDISVELTSVTSHYNMEGFKVSTMFVYFLWEINVRNKPKSQSRMGNRETQKTLGTRHRKHWAQDTGNIGHKTQNEDKRNNKHNTEYLKTMCLHLSTWKQKMLFWLYMFYICKTNRYILLNISINQMIA
jgi:hypothetical protein